MNLESFYWKVRRANKWSYGNHIAILPSVVEPTTILHVVLALTPLAKHKWFERHIPRSTWRVHLIRDQGNNYQVTGSSGHAV